MGNATEEQQLERESGREVLEIMFHLSSAPEVRGPDQGLGADGVFRSGTPDFGHKSVATSTPREKNRLDCVM
jgi:hypothetical protein